MCGVVGYIGEKQAWPIILDGQKRLEYRGYDSAGIAIGDGGLELRKIRAVGKTAIAQIRAIAEEEKLKGTYGIGHNRWATHGGKTEENAHPHADCTNEIQVVHNGQVENCVALKKALEGAGHVFTSETDTEVIAHLIESYMVAGANFVEAVRETVKQLRGTFGIVVMHSQIPNTLVAARFGSPLVLGIGESEVFVASDASPIVAHTKEVIYMEDGEMAVLGARGSYRISTFENVQVARSVERINLTVDEIQKSGFPHFMLKEINEQDKVLRDTLAGRLDSYDGLAILGGIRNHEAVLAGATNIIILACGTAYHAGLVGAKMIEDLARIPVRVMFASEFRYSNVAMPEGTVVFAISQSGETYDTLEAVREAKRRGAQAFGIVNVVGSSIARECKRGVYTHAGFEIGVASTKAFVCQLAVMAEIALYLGRACGLSLAEGQRIVAALMSLPHKVEKLLQGLAASKKVEDLAAFLKDTRGMFYIGRDYMYPIALEGALKLKEIAYVHAEGYAAGELKHGPLALIEKDTPCVVLCPSDSLLEKTRLTIRQLKANGAQVIVISSEDLQEVPEFFEVRIPSGGSPVTDAILATIPLQLLAYHMAVKRGHDPDMPRNLAKSVTVE
ncbi:MAG: glutamine--fructose-6-phosphate transaminase (isomerizing) [bacterium]